jgi:hypothetical protein
LEYIDLLLLFSLGAAVKKKTLLLLLRGNLPNININIGNN